MVALAALLYDPSPALAQVSLGAAEDFAVLAGTAVTCTDSVVIGDVGVDLGGAVTQTNCTIFGTVDPAAEQAYDDFLAAYADLAAESCGTFLTVLSGQTLVPGTYCVTAAATETGGVLTLNGSSTDTWIFKIGTGGTGALTGTNFSVVMPGGETCNNNVFWWTAEAATLTDSVFIGSILAGTSITVTGGSLDGQALAKVAVTLTNADVCGSGSGVTFPPADAIKVTGGGQIPVPNPDSNDPTATGKGRATFGFNAQPNKDGTATGHFNYLNHVTGLHVNGPVTDIQVIELNLEGSPKTVRFFGTCGANLPACSFSVRVEDNDEPGRNDEFGIYVTGALSEIRSQRIISRGNIQFHK